MRRALASCLTVAMLFAAPVHAEAENPLRAGGSWDDLAYDILGDVTPEPAGDALALDAPFRAYDPALVPVHLTQPPDAPVIGELVLVVDENPAPVAATIRLSPAMHPLDFEMRVRVEQYSNIRAIAESEGGTLMTGRFVRATGGCAAPAGRDAAEALAQMGRMRLLSLQKADGYRQVRLMIRHPNYSGLQRDQRTLLNIPAHFVDQLEVWQGEEMLFAVEGGISVSEDPVYDFRFRDNGAPALRVVATDTRGNRFEQDLPLEGRG
ncbi:quinoprotein dehydrogenase-associated SoxYZ-like carrier [Halodurantibacterium flavum]|uniref:Quinoprotein dehydrogenase-associated SoxYZ-like carrier n=1 Tax=Halodurantibacterium flavum TaxID=1382802 RepID=A0ABW4S9Y6_9RHOB